MKLQLALLLALSSSFANASIILTSGTATGVNNVLFNGANQTTQTGPTVFGTVSGNTVFFTSTESLTAQGGQAKLDASDGNLDQPLTLTVPGFTFSLIDFNPELKGRNAPVPGNLAITAIGTVSGAQMFNFALGGPGNDKFYLTAANEAITSVTLDALNGFSDLKQVRIGDLTPIGPADGAVPEPSSWALLVGAVPGLWVLRQRGKAR